MILRSALAFRFSRRAMLVSGQTRWVGVSRNVPAGGGPTILFGVWWMPMSCGSCLERTDARLVSHGHRAACAADLILPVRDSCVCEL